MTGGAGKLSLVPTFEPNQHLSGRRRWSERNVVSLPVSPPPFQISKSCPGQCTAWLISHRSYKKQSLRAPPPPVLLVSWAQG